MPDPRVTTVADVAQLEAALGPRPSFGRAAALIGGADVLGDAGDGALDRFFDALTGALQRLEVTLVDGGTDSGVMRLIGEARRRAGGSFRLIGVAPEGTLERPSRDGLPIRLAADHPEILLVPGDQFGDETDWLFRTADYLGSDAAATFVVNGGRLSFEEAIGRLREGRIVFTVAGSGRAADILAGAPGEDGVGPLPDDLRGESNLRIVPMTIAASDIESLMAHPERGANA